MMGRPGGRVDVPGLILAEATCHLYSFTALFPVFTVYCHIEAQAMKIIFRTILR